MCWKIQLRHGAERPPQPRPGRGGGRSTPWETSGNLNTWDTWSQVTGSREGAWKQGNHLLQAGGTPASPAEESWGWTFGSRQRRWGEDGGAGHPGAPEPSRAGAGRAEGQAAWFRVCEAPKGLPVPLGLGFPFSKTGRAAPAKGQSLQTGQWGGLGGRMWRGRAGSPIPGPLGVPPSTFHEWVVISSSLGLVIPGPASLCPFPFPARFCVLDLPGVATRWRGRDALPELRGVGWEPGLESSRAPSLAEGKVG